MTKRSLVLLSGGLDSVYALHKAREESNVLFVITFDYGQRSAASEISHARELCTKFGVAHKILELPFFKELAGHPLFDTTATCPAPSTTDLDDRHASLESAKAVWVPNRNGIFLNVAAGLAEAAQAHFIYVGFNAEEAATFPDNSRGYVEAVNEAFAYSTSNRVEVRSPSQDMIKTEIVAELKHRGFDFKNLWSCYVAGEKMCGCCESCARLKRALRANEMTEQFGDLFLC